MWNRLKRKQGEIILQNQTKHASKKKKKRKKPNKTKAASHSKQLIIINDRCASTRDYVRFSPTTLTRHIKLTFVYVRVRLSRATAHRTDHMLHYWIQRKNSESFFRQTYTSVVGSKQLGARHLVLFTMFSPSSSSSSSPPPSRWDSRRLSSYIALLPSVTQQNQFNVMLEACCRKCRRHLLHTHAHTQSHSLTGTSRAVAPCSPRPPWRLCPAAWFLTARRGSAGLTWDQIHTCAICLSVHGTGICARAR